MRLKLANGLITKTDEFMEMAQLSLQAGFPVEAKAIVDKGYAAGALGTGDQAERHKRLKDLVAKQAGRKRCRHRPGRERGCGPQGRQ